MKRSTEGEITRLVHASAYDKAAQDDLYAIVYKELKQIAYSLLPPRKNGTTWQATDLMDECVIRLRKPTLLTSLADRKHFYATAAKVMRELIISYRRRKKAGKRGGSWTRIPLDDVLDRCEAKCGGNVLAFDKELRVLSQERPLQAQIVEMHFWGGQSLAKISSFLEMSESKIRGEWKKAKTRLKELLTKEGTNE